MKKLLFLYLLLISLVTPCLAYEVVDIKVESPENKVYSSGIDVVNPAIQPTKKKTKRKWFQRAKERLINNRIHRLITKHLRDSTKCDKLVLKSGRRIKVKVRMLTDEVIQYTKCGDKDSTIYNMSISQIDKIYYRDGTKKRIVPDTPTTPEYTGKRAKDPYTTGFLLGLFLGLIGVMIATSIFKHPEDRKYGVRSAIAGLLAFLLIIFLLAAFVFKNTV